MEGSPMSQANLIPLVLEKEEMMWQFAIERTTEALEKDIDFVLISNILRDIYKKCFPGIPAEILDAKIENLSHIKCDVLYTIINPDDLKNSLTEGVEAHTDGKVIQYAASKCCDDEGNPDVPKLLKVSIHELLHIAAGRSLATGTGEVFSTGIDQAKQIHIGKEALYFRNINEGLTELIADAVYSEYLARKGEVSSSCSLEDVHLPEGEFALPGRYISYENERIAIYSLIDELEKVSGFSYDTICQTLVKEYFTNGYVLRDEMVEAFEGNPEIIQILERYKRNLIEDYGNDVHAYLHDTLQGSEVHFIKAIFGRDVIGVYNKKVVESL